MKRLGTNSRFSIGHYLPSPHYLFHRAIHQIRMLEIYWKIGRFTPLARQATARRVLQLWQQSGNYLGAGEYIHAIRNTANDAEAEGKMIDACDLAVP
jgi:hypothetical protein